MRSCVSFYRKWGGSMRALLFITRKNIQKKKGDAVVLLCLIALAALLLYTSISVFQEMDTVLLDAYEQAHTADFLYIGGTEKEKAGEIISSKEEVVEYEVSEGLFLNAGYRKAGESEKKQSQFYVAKFDEKREISKLVGLEKMKTEENSVLLPYYMKAAESYAVGDEFLMTVGNTEYRFFVAGFVGDPMFATPSNVSARGIYISDVFMKKMVGENETAWAARSMQHRARLEKGVDTEALDHELSSMLQAELPESAGLSMSLNWDAMKGGVKMMASISMGIMLLFSILLILVALIVIRFCIWNFMEMNVKNVGILQAAGYTSGQLNISVMMEMALIAVVAIGIGITLGAAGSGLIGLFQGVMMGIYWNQKMHVRAALFTAVFILGIVCVIAFLCGRIYKRLSVLDALRGGIKTHNFRKNYFPFEKGRAPMALILAGKSMLHEKAKSISVFCIVVLLSFSACIGFELYESFGATTDNLMKLSGLEIGDCYVEGEHLEKVGRELETWEEIESVLYYYGIADIRLESKDRETKVSCDIYENPELLHNEIVVKGRLPRLDNEIILTTNIAKRLGVDCGDTIYVTGNGERMDYIVCGIDQKMNNMGLKAMMTKEGACRLNGSSQVFLLYVYAADGIGYEKIREKVERMFPLENVTVVDSKKDIEGVMNGITIAFKAICILFVSITVFVVIIVEILLIRSKVIKEWRKLGLNKALGFTTGQLIVQMMMTNLPLIAGGALAGAVLSHFLLEPLTVVCLSFCGIQKCTLLWNPVWMAVTIGGIILLAAASSFLVSVRIRKLEPVRMLMEEV